MDNKVFLSSLTKKEKIPLGQRLQAAANTFFGNILNGIGLAFMAPFNALSVLLTSERTMLDTSKISLDMLMPQQQQQVDQEIPYASEEDSAQHDSIKDFFDVREPWKKAHDEEYGDENGRA